MAENNQLVPTTQGCPKDGILFAPGIQVPHDVIVNFSQYMVDYAHASAYNNMIAAYNANTPCVNSFNTHTTPMQDCPYCCPYCYPYNCRYNQPYNPYNPYTSHTQSNYPPMPPPQKHLSENWHPTTGTPLDCVVKDTVASMSIGPQEPIFYKVPATTSAFGVIDKNLLTSVLLVAYAENGMLYTLVFRHFSESKKFLISSPGGFMQGGRQWGPAASLMVVRKTGLDIRDHHFHVLSDNTEMDIPNCRKTVNFYVFVPRPQESKTAMQTARVRLDPTFANTVTRNKWIPVHELLSGKHGELDCHFELNLNLLASKIAI